MRISAEQAKEIDQQCGSLSRSEWLRGLIDDALGGVPATKGKRQPPGAACRHPLNLRIGRWCGSCQRDI